MVLDRIVLARLIAALNDPPRAKQVWDAINNTSGSPSKITDADGDTYLEVEESPDEDIIRGYVGGVSALVVGAAGTIVGVGASGGASAVAVGAAAVAPQAASVAVGPGATTVASGGTPAVAVGSAAVSEQGVAVGGSADGSGVSSVAVGPNTVAADGTVAVGPGATTSDLRSVAVGPTATAGSDGVAAGYMATTVADGVAAGREALVSVVGGVAIGEFAESEGGPAVGRQAVSKGSTGSTAIGAFCQVDGVNRIAIGSGSSSTPLDPTVDNLIVLGFDQGANTRGLCAIGLQPDDAGTGFIIRGAVGGGLVPGQRPDAAIHARGSANGARQLVLQNPTNAANQPTNENDVTSAPPTIGEVRWRSLGAGGDGAIYICVDDVTPTWRRVSFDAAGW